MDTESQPPETTNMSAGQRALLDALDSVLAPLAQLCLSKGITIQTIEDRLRQAYVKAARRTLGTTQGQRLGSRISAMTGLTRREVARLDRPLEPPRPPRTSPVLELFTRWLSDPSLRSDDRLPVALARQGPMPSFEALARSVTQDLHPRALLDELCRLKLVRHDEANDQVHLLRDAFVPHGDWSRMLSFLGDNVGDHLRAASANVLGDGRQHLEQSILADELSEASLAIMRDVMSQQWRTLLAQLAPQLEALIEADRAAGRPQNQSLRIGLYTWSQPMADTPHSRKPEENAP